MRIQEVRAPRPSPLTRKVLMNSGGAVPVDLRAAVPGTAAPNDRKTEGHLAPLLAKGTLPLQLGGVYKGGSYLLTQMNAVTTPQLAEVLQSYHLVNDSTLAHSQAQTILGLVQSKAVNSILIGAFSGAAVVITVDKIRPEWPLGIKLAIGFVVALAISGALYFGLTDKPETPNISASPSSTK
jgi:hypothetical protein